MGIFQQLLCADVLSMGARRVLSPRGCCGRFCPKTRIPIDENKAAVDKNQNLFDKQDLSRIIVADCDSTLPSNPQSRTQGNQSLKLFSTLRRFFP